MTGHLAYQISQTRIDDVRRQAAEQRLAKEARLRPDASPRQMLRQPQRRPTRLRRALRALGSSTGDTLSASPQGVRYSVSSKTPARRRFRSAL